MLGPRIRNSPLKLVNKNIRRRFRGKLETFLLRNRARRVVSDALNPTVRKILCPTQILIYRMYILHEAI